MPQPVSVIVPLFNKRSYVRETLESVLNQTVPVHQIIVVDDGSSDGGAEVVESFREPHIRLLRQPNAGVAAARNKGIELATGDLISFLDADDRYRPGYIENLLQMAERFPQAGLLATSFVKFWEGGPALQAPIPATASAVGSLWDDFYGTWNNGAFFWTGSVAVRSSVLADATFRFPVGERLGEDQDLWFRLAEAVPIAFSSAVLSEYRMGVPGSATQSSHVPAILPCYARLSARLAADQVPRSMRGGARRLLASHLISIARQHLADGNFAAARALLSDQRAAGNLAYRFRTYASLAAATLLHSIRP